MKIELKDSIEGLEEIYRSKVNEFIRLGLITLDEWNTKFNAYRDDSGYSIIHYLTCVVEKIDIFLTSNKIILENKQELEERFNVKILTPDEINKES